MYPNILRVARIAILALLIVFAAPTLGLAQADANPPSIPSINNLNLNDLQQSLPAPVSGFVNKLKGIFEGASGGGISSVNAPQLNFSDARSAWRSINDWFVSRIGISLAEIVKAVVNFIIWIWELIIKLIQLGLSYL